MVHATHPAWMENGAMIELRNDRLKVGFPELHPLARCSIAFQRTLRVPDDNQDYPLPAGLGRFPLHAVDGFEVPAAWREHGGVFLPMYQSEALWIALNTAYPRYPMALKIAAGKINAISGLPWTDALQDDPQDYVVIPEQPWLDGFNVADGVIRQFVAAPLGAGLTAEEQITGEAAWGGLQFVVYPMKAEVYRKRVERARTVDVTYGDYLDVPMFCRRSTEEMGLAPGGRITQTIAEDPWGLDVWDTQVRSRCFVHLLNSGHYRALTGQPPPTTPMTAKTYRDAGLPWFDFYQEGKTLRGSKVLARLDGLATALHKRRQSLDGNAPIVIAKTIELGKRAQAVRDGVF